MLPCRQQVRSHCKSVDVIRMHVSHFAPDVNPAEIVHTLGRHMLILVQKIRPSSVLFVKKSQGVLEAKQKTI